MGTAWGFHLRTRLGNTNLEHPNVVQHTLAGESKKAVNLILVVEQPGLLKPHGEEEHVRPDVELIQCINFSVRLWLWSWVDKCQHSSLQRAALPEFTLSPLANFAPVDEN